MEIMRNMKRQHTLTYIFFVYNLIIWFIAESFYLDAAFPPSKMQTENRNLCRRPLTKLRILLRIQGRLRKFLVK